MIPIFIGPDQFLNPEGQTSITNGSNRLSGSDLTTSTICIQCPPQGCYQVGSFVIVCRVIAVHRTVVYSSLSIARLCSTPTSPPYLDLFVRSTYLVGRIGSIQVRLGWALIWCDWNGTTHRLERGLLLWFLSGQFRFESGQFRFDLIGSDSLVEWAHDWDC